MDNDLIERLSEHVHNAWMAEKQRQGFTDHIWPPDSGYTVTGIKDGVPMMQVRCKIDGCNASESKHHTDMLPYVELPENVKEYDRATVRGVLAALESEGQQVVSIDKIRRMGTAIGMLNSMVLSGESHSETSRAVVREAVA